MLRPLLLFCLVATIVSADNINNHANVSTNSGDSGNLPPLPKQEGSVNTDDTKTSTSSVNSIAIITKPDSTTKPITITNKTTTTTSEITTTTSKSITTTSKSITTTSKPTTTIKPTTTPTPVPTTVAPVSTTPLPTPTTGKWLLWENNTLCVIVQIAAQINVSFTDANNMTIEKAIDIPIPRNNSKDITGKCGNIEQIVTLSWELQNSSASKDNFTLHFQKNETEKHYSLHHLEISLASEEFPNAKLNDNVILMHIVPQFTTGLSNSYRCIKEQSLDLSLKNKTVGVLKVSHLQFQAFRSDNTTNFGLAKDCSFDTPDIVPITVGCALAGLVVIVLIAYLVGRRRSQARGYLSM